MSLRTFLFGKDADNNKGHRVKKRKDLYEVLCYSTYEPFEGYHSEKQIEADAKYYVKNSHSVVRDCVSNMGKTHTPKIFFENVESAETVLKNVLVIKKYYPKFAGNAEQELQKFRALRVQHFYAFADRFFARVENEYKRSPNRGAAELSRLAVYEKEMLPEERQYYTDKKSKL